MAKIQRNVVLLQIPTQEPKLCQLVLVKFPEPCNEASHGALVAKFIS